MKVIRASLRLTFRKGIGLLLDKSTKLELKENERFGLIYFSSFGRLTSVFAEITEVKQDGDENLVYLDKRIAGELGDGDVVQIMVTTAPPTADMVYLAVPNTINIPAGNWTNIIREGNIGRVLDYGADMSFVVPSTLREPYIVQAKIITTLPVPPAITSEGTKYFVLKKSQNELSELLVSSLEKRKLRAIEVIDSIEQGYIDMLIELKNDHLENFGRSVEFQSIPKIAFESIKAAFASYNVVQDNITVDSYDSFIGNFMISSKKGSKDMTIVEIIITGKEKTGKAAIWTYGENVDTLKTKMTKEILPKINIALEGVKEGPELIDMYCAGNCGEYLDINAVNEEGVIKCPSCDTLNMIPSRLRVH